MKRSAEGKISMQSPNRLTRTSLVAIVLVVSMAHRPTLGEEAPAGQKPAQGREVPAQPSESPLEQFEAIQSAFTPPDRSTLLLFGRARLLLEERRYAEAVQCLGAILESPNDFFFRPDRTAPSHSSLKSEAQRLLGGMSPRGRELYELQFGPVARRMLRDAAIAGDADGLAGVSRRFFHTQAGYEATLLLGLYHLDHGRPMAGALTLERLQDRSGDAGRFEPVLSLALATCWARAGAPDNARRALAGLSLFRSDAGVQIGGEQVGWFGPEGDPLVWLADLLGPQSTADPEQADQWTMLRGGPSRNASAEAGGPLLNKRWRVPTTWYPEVEHLIEKVRREQIEEDGPLLPGLHPLVVDDVVLMRTTKNLLAVDLPTGKRIWEVPVEDPFDEALDPAGRTGFRQGSQLETSLRLRMWADTTFGTLASDGRYVFAVEDLPLHTSPYYRRQVILGALRPQTAAALKPFNRLAAYDVKSGKLKWHVGGSAQQFGLPLAGTFFLGPPLPLMGNLYVLAEIKGEIRLLALDARRGTLLWEQQLAIVDRDVLNDPLRRLAGVSPSFADGILVCPTASKAVVALELTTRSLLWGYTYAPEDAETQQRAAMFLTIRQDRNPDPSGRWLDSSVVLAESHVLITPVDSNQLHCLNLLDGTLLWKQPRRDACYLACVHDGKAVLVGRNKVWATHLIDGSPAWEGRQVDLPPGSRPSGTGLLSGNCYFLPLSSAQVMTIDLDQGRAGRTFTSRQQDVPGNLVSYRGTIISQRADGVEAFYQLDPLRDLVAKQLADDGDDPESLTLEGEILWDEGRLSDAVESFYRAWSLAPSVFRKEMLRSALFAGLATDFADYRHRVDKVRRLIDEPAQEATLLRLLAVGLADAGEFNAAIDHYHKLIELDLENRGMEKVDDSHQVRRDRWIRSQLTALREKMPAEFRAEMDRRTDRRFQAAMAEDTAESLHRFLEYFGSQPAGDEARRELAQHLKDSGRLLAMELVLKEQPQSQDPQRAARATAELAAAFHAAGRHRDAATYYGLLQRQFADVPCKQNQTGRELCDALAADDPVRKVLHPKSPWPAGEVLTELKAAPKANTSSLNRAVLEFRGSCSPFFSDVTIELERTPPQLVGRDGYGRKQWHLPLDEFAPQEYFTIGRGVMRVDALDHLLLLSMGHKIVAIDTLGGADDDSPRVIWSQDLNLPDVDAIRRQQMRNRLGNVPGGLGRIRFSGSLYPLVNSPEAISEQVICFKRSQQLIAVDPLSGDPLWIREDVRPDSAVFGDDEVVLVVPPRQTKAMVLRASDGRLLGHREVPDEAERITPVGRRLLVWRNFGGQSALHLIDPWRGQGEREPAGESAETESAEMDSPNKSAGSAREETEKPRDVWSTRRFDDDARLFLLPGEAVAILEPDGKFLLVDLADGRAIIDRQLLAEAALTEIFLFHTADQYLLVTSSQQGPSDLSRRTYNIHGMAGVKINRGHVYAFDSAGNTRWPSPVRVEDHFLPLNQPSRLPVLTFACAVQVRKPGTAQTRAKVAILCLDKRSGRVVCNEEVADSSNFFALIGDPERKVVEVRLPGNRITMTFTDNPLPPEDESQKAAPTELPQNRSIGRSLWKALRKAIADEMSRPAAIPGGGDSAHAEQPRADTSPQQDGRQAGPPVPTPEDAPRPLHPDE